MIEGVSRGWNILVVIVGSATVAACSLTALDGFSDGAGSDAGAPSADGGADSPAAPTDAGAGALDARTTDVSCDPSSRILPLRAFDMTSAPSAEIGPACSSDSVLVEDGIFAGLDHVGLVEAQLDGTNVTACIGVELPTAVSLITVRMKPTPQGCGHACGANCGTGHTAKVFASANEAAYVHIEEVALADGVADYTLDVPDKVGLARFVAVCRPGWGNARDDLAVDVIRGACR
jgi:hypothetical protein